MDRTPRQFVEESLLPDFPPTHPLRNPGWAGLAFDRNLYEDQAPEPVWDALFAAHVHRAGQEKVLVVAAEDLDRPSAGEPVEPSRAAVMAYLHENLHFLKDHYILPPTRTWLCRLDQDVTLIAGERDLMQEVVAACGGLESVRKIMESDFDPGPADSVGLRRYLVGLVHGIGAEGADER
ncbi:MAG: hypothetical protein JNL16_15575 [Dechloromonas sp.]|nr:hypothetical protein [Dechloromonas sp.]